MLAAAKLLRGAEEDGHLEPLRAGAISPHGLLASALAALYTTHVVFAIAIGVGHTAGGMDAATSWATGGAMALLTATFATGTALASQLAATRRRADGTVGAALGLDWPLTVRVAAAASATPDWVWWTTPFGWIGFLHEVDQARGQVFLGLVLLLGVLVAAAFATARRDLHAGVLDPGERAPARLVRPVRSQSALAVRLTAGPARTWSFLFGVLLLAVFATGQVAAIREEEATWRIEHLLVRPVSRVRWLVTRVLTTAAAVVAIALAAGVLAWVATSVAGAPIAFVDGLLAAVNIIPVAWLALGVGIALFGLLPRRTVPVTYGLVIGAFLLDFVGGLLDLPEAVLDLSPFRHLAAVPAADMNMPAAVVMLAVAALGVTVGVVAFRRRDLKEA